MTIRRYHHHTAIELVLRQLSYPLEDGQKVFDGITTTSGQGYGQFISHAKLDHNDSGRIDIQFINANKVCFQIFNVDVVECID